MLCLLCWLCLLYAAWWRQATTKLDFPQPMWFASALDPGPGTWGNIYMYYSTKMMYDALGFFIYFMHLHLLWFTCEQACTLNGLSCLTLNSMAAAFTQVLVDLAKWHATRSEEAQHLSQVLPTKQWVQAHQWKLVEAEARRIWHLARSAPKTHLGLWRLWHEKNPTV